MSEGTTGILILIGISLITALLCHWLIRNYFIAALCALVIADTAFQFAAYLHDGHLDPFFIIALVTGGGIAFAIAVMVGVPFIWIRRKRKDNPAV